MTKEWKIRILELKYWETEKEALEYVRLVDMAENNCDLDTCKVLMKTFVTGDDFGVQEAVVRVLSSAKIKDYQIALLEELPRLLRDAPQWSEVLIERELKYHSKQFKETLMSASRAAREGFDEVFRREYFRSEYGNADGSSDA